ncbi:hypothetical protein COT72_02865 [archaeon CG10_big_fil_rev_8_21_14_0_10_43_11]|nr:MAG: hypothetical protein COT72_02865 [archaeon CG10_big_fil_rev_8_21_14_0_10_43_11]
MVATPDLIGLVVTIVVFSAIILLSGIIGRLLQGRAQATFVLCTVGLYSTTALVWIAQTAGIDMQVVNFFELLDVLFYDDQIPFFAAIPILNLFGALVSAKAVVFMMWGVAFDVAYNLKDLLSKYANIEGIIATVTSSATFIALLFMAAITTLFVVASKGCFIFESVCPVLQGLDYLQPIFSYYPFGIGLIAVGMSIITALSRRGEEGGFGTDLKTNIILLIVIAYIVTISVFSLTVVPAAVGTVLS